MGYPRLAIFIAILASFLLIQAARLRIRMHRDREAGVKFWNAEMQKDRNDRFGPRGQELGGPVALLGWTGIVLLLVAVITSMLP